MIDVYVYRNESGCIYGFRSEGHGDPLVCSAASALTLNAVNSVEAFTELDLTCDLGGGGYLDGYLDFVIPCIKEGASNRDCSLLLEAALLGLRSLADDNENDIKIHDDNMI